MTEGNAAEAAGNTFAEGVTNSGNPKVTRKSLLADLTSNALNQLEWVKENPDDGSHKAENDDLPELISDSSDSDSSVGDNSEEGRFVMISPRTSLKPSQHVMLMCYQLESLSRKSLKLQDL